MICVSVKVKNKQRIKCIRCALGILGFVVPKHTRECLIKIHHGLISVSGLSFLLISFCDFLSAKNSTGNNVSIASEIGQSGLEEKMAQIIRFLAYHLYMYYKSEEKKYIYYK